MNESENRPATMREKRRKINNHSGSKQMRRISNDFHVFDDDIIWCRPKKKEAAFSKCAMRASDTLGDWAFSTCSIGIVASYILCFSQTILPDDKPISACSAYGILHLNHTTAISYFLHSRHLGQIFPFKVYLYLIW